MSEVLHSSDATFVADVVNSDVPVLLDFGHRGVVRAK